MKTTTITDFKKKIKSHLGELEKDQDILILSGAKYNGFVVLTLDQYNAMEEPPICYQLLPMQLTYSKVSSKTKLENQNTVSSLIFT